MREEIYPHIRDARSLPEVESGLLTALRTAREVSPEQRVGVVPGIVTSRGDEHTQWHLDRLCRYAAWVQERNPFPVFTTPHAFNAELYAQLQECQFPREVREPHFQRFWRNINGSGLITDFFMTPHWNLSVGACDEHLTAKNVGARIHYLEAIPEYEDFEGYLARQEQRTAIFAA